MAVPLNRWHVIFFRQNLLTVGSSSFRCIVWKRPGSDFTFTRLRHQMETFSALLAVCAWNSPVSGEFPHKGQWRGALVFSRICAWINDWVKNGGAGDLRHYRTHYAVSVMQIETIGFTELNSLALGRLDDNLKCNLRTLYLGLISWALLVKFLSDKRKNTFHGESTLAHVMACCRQVTSHYRSQCWPQIYVVTRVRISQPWN